MKTLLHALEALRFPTVTTTLTLVCASVVLCSHVGCAADEPPNAKNLPRTQHSADLQRKLVELEWKIAENRAAANRIVTGPVVEGRVYVAPGVPRTDDKTRNPSTDTYQRRQGPTVYDKDSPKRLSDLQEQKLNLENQYSALEQELRWAGCSIPRLLKCDSCDGAGIRGGPHYELGRREDGSIGNVFVTSGLSVCSSCNGFGVAKPGDPQAAARLEKTPSGQTPPAPTNQEPTVFAGVDSLCSQVPKYNNKPVSVTGLVARVHADSNRVDLQDRVADFSGRWMDLGSRNFASCTFKEQDKAAVLALQPGQRITLVGIVSANQPGGSSVFVMENCLLKQ